MSKLITVRVNDRESYKMTPEDAARFWLERERAAQARQASAMAAVMADRVEASGWGVVMRGDDQAVRALLASSGLEIVADEPECRFERTLILNPKVPLKLDLLPVGFRFLDRFEVAAPIWSYDQLAADLGTEEERGRTQAVIRDLRAPVYETGALFLKRCETTEDLLAAWRTERQAGGDEKLAFQRALYAVKPLILPLPTVWVHGK